MKAAINVVPDLDRLANEFERAWQETGKAELAKYLPSRDHSHFDRIACELVCIDMEMRWSRGESKSLTEYRGEYPHLFHNPAVLQELAYEDYRQRLQAGLSTEPWEYRDRFGIDVTEWPTSSRTACSQLSPRTQVLDTQPVVDGLPRTTEARAAIVDALRRSAPRDAERLNEVIEQMPDCGDHVFGFELVQELGEGAFAKVFLAHQSELADRPVALKVALTLSDEPRKLARLQHTNIVPIYSTHHSKGLHAVCMPYMGSLTLDHLLKSMCVQPGSFPKSGRELLSTLYDKHSTTVEQSSDGHHANGVNPAKVDSAVATPILDMMARFSHIEAVLWMGKQVANGLAHAHERGIMHLDLKPANILLTDDGQPMLLDFNLSIDLNEVDSLQMVRLGGTLPYMSPEQLDAFGGGKRDIDVRSDLYSVGVILFELLTGTSPFPRRIGRMKDVVEAMRSDREKNTPSPREHNPAISPAVDAIVRKLLEKDRTRRYQSVAELREDLERQLADLPLKYAPDRSLPERARKWRRRHPRSAVALLVGAIATVFLLMPTTVLAVRQNQIAKRKMELETAEARQQWQESSKEARIAQVLLATQTGNRALLDEGIERGKGVLEKYGIGHDPDWMMKPLFARLSADEQNEVRLELGEMLFFMARGEQILADDASDDFTKQTGLRTALRWNELAANCYPADQLPRMLIKRHKKLIEDLPRDADRSSIPAWPEGSAAEYDAYHDGVEHAMAGRFRDALDLLIPFTEEHPHHFQSWYVRGICHERVGENAESITCWTACIALDPDMHLAYFNRGLVRLHESDFVRANRDFTHALELKPGWTEALMNRAIARKGMKDYARAIADLNKVVAKHDSSVQARFLRAEIKELNNKPEEAKIEFAEAMKIEPNDELGWSTRGHARLETDPKAALDDFNQAIRRNPRSHDALINKSIVLSEFLNRQRDAVAVLDQFLDYYPDHIGARMGRGVVLARLGECKRARSDAEEALKHDRSPFFLFQAAGLYAQISRHEQGNEAKKEALSLLGSALQKGFSDLELLKTDPDLDPVRGEAEFKRLLEIAAGLKISAVK